MCATVGGGEIVVDGQACGHLLDALRLHGRHLTGLLDLVDGAPMQVQGNTQHRHQQCRDQRDLATKHAATALHAFGIGQQLTRRLGATGFELSIVKHAILALGLQLLQALLVESDVECCAVFFSLQLANTQHRNQQKRQGGQQQQPGWQPEIDHLSFLS